MASSPDPRYYHDGYGLRPRWRLFFIAPRQYVWLVLPMSVKMIYIRYRDRGRRR